MLLLDGKTLAKKVHAEIYAKVQNLKRAPGLAVILVGDNPASQTYVANKEKTASQKCGFRTFNSVLPKDASFNDVAKTIEAYNKNDEVDGILVQLPLPKHLDSAKLINLIDPKKDVDGLHPVNQGALMRGIPGLRPCTPAGIMKLIDLAYNNGEFSDSIPEKDLSGKSAVVIGRSILVGKPVAQLLLERNATVSIVHSRTADIKNYTRVADIVVAAVGVPSLVKEDFVKDGAIVIDVGINRTEEGKLVGDVDFSAMAEKCFAITPVPGGVGPMTVAMLMANTLQAYIEHH